MDRVRIIDRHAARRCGIGHAGDCQARRTAGHIISKPYGICGEPVVDDYLHPEVATCIQRIVNGSKVKRILNPGGILVTQNGVAFFQLEEVQTTARRMSRHFSDTTFYSAAVPTYYGGIMTFAWGSNELAMRDIDVDTLNQRYDASGIDTLYYTPDIHKASFALPKYVVDAIAETRV